MKRPWWNLCVIMLLAGHSQALRAEESAPKGVRVGDWTVSGGDGYFETLRDGKETALAWSGVATKAKDLAHILIVTAADAARIEDLKEEINLPNLGMARFGVSKEKKGVPQFPSMERSISVRLAWRTPQQWVLVEASRPVSLPMGETPQAWERRVQSAIETTRKGLPTDPALDLLTRLVQENPVLDRQRIATRALEVQAGVNGAQFQPLKRRESFKSPFNMTAWPLPAKPGDRVVLRVCAPFREYVIRPQSIEQVDADETALIESLQVNGKTGTSVNRETVQVDLGVLEDARMLMLTIRNWRSSGDKIMQALPLRWGRPEEAWLDTALFPVADKLDNPTSENAASALLRDLESAYDPDRNAWFRRRGDGDLERPSWGIYMALRGLDEQAHPHLATLARNQVVRNPVLPVTTLQPANWLQEAFGGYYWLSWTDEDLESENAQVLPQRARALLKRIAASPQATALAKPKDAYRQGEPSSWHDPRIVYGLAVLWQAGFKAEDGNPLREVLDYWVSAMPQNPDPVHEDGKATVGYDKDLETRGYAIAALHLGFEALQKPEYREMRDLQMRRMVELLKTSGALALIRDGAGPPHGESKFVSLLGTDDLAHVVSIYGQTCAFVGEKDGLEQARAWALAALGRKAVPGWPAYFPYEKATFLDRCGLLAVVQGRAAFLAPPVFAR